jgi:hypothetical protein
MTIGPVSSPIGNPAVVTFDLSSTPQLIGTGPIAGTPVILVEVGARRGRFGFPRPSGVELRATAPANLLSGTNQIPITDISWTSVLPAGAGYSNVIPAGSFVSGLQVVATLNLPSGRPQWMGGELTFYFANNTVYPAGTYGGAGSGVVTYTATFVP